MKKAFILFIATLLAFIGTWMIKSKTPAVRPDSYQNGLSGLGNWWISTVSADDVDSIWKLDPEVPDNYIPVPGENELYMVIDENGHILKYRQRTKQTDGAWIWKDVNPDIPKNYEKVDGLDNVYKVIDENGIVHFYRYVRNKDNDTYAFVEVDEFGNDLEIKIPTGIDIPDNFIHMGDNVYAILNEHGVVVGYKQRYIDSNGNYAWRNVEKPDLSVSENPLNMDYTSWLGEITGEDIRGGISVSKNPDISMPEIIVVPADPQTTQTQMLSDGTYVDTETLYTTEKSGEYIVTYMTTVQKTYSSNGELLMTKMDGPTEISREAITNNTGETPDKSKIATTLSAEYARISVGISFRDGLANEILAHINAERAKEGLPALSMSSSGDSVKLAKSRAAAMAKFDSSDYKNPLYGDLQSMMQRFGISGIPSENTWRTSSSRTAKDIHSRFLATESARAAMLEKIYTEVGIGIAEKNGYIYICEVYYK